MVEKAALLTHFGGVYSGSIKPTPFLCLTLKLLQIQPDKDIIIEFIQQDDFKFDAPSLLPNTVAKARRAVNTQGRWDEMLPERLLNIQAPS